MIINFTPSFVKALNNLFGFTIFLFGFSLLMFLNQMNGFNTQGSTPGTRILLNLFETFLSIGVFWFAVAYVTKEKKGALVGFCIHLLPVLWLYYQVYTVGYSPIIFANIYWSSMVSQVLGFSLFGLFYFKNKVGLLLILVYIVMNGISVGRGGMEYFHLIDYFMKLIGFEDLFELRHSTESGGYRSTNIFRMFVDALYIPLKFIVFWAIFSGIKKINNFDISLRTVSVIPTLNKVSVSIVYWVFRLILMSTIFGAAVFIISVARQEFNFKTLLKLFYFCISIFVISSLFRNFLTSWFVSKGIYPAWLYFFLNFPILNFFIWLSLLFKQGNKVKLPANTEDIILDAPVETQGELDAQEVQEAQQLQKEFERDGKNNGVKTLLIVILILFSVFSIGKISSYSSDGELAILFLNSLISIGLVIWYINDKRALFIIFILQSVILLIAISGFKHLIAFVPLAGLINLCIFYSLFHFDRLTFVKNEEEEISEFNT